MAMIVKHHTNAWGKQLPGTRIFYWWITTATRGVVGAIATFFLMDINHQVPWMISRQANIFVCTLWSRHGLYLCLHYLWCMMCLWRQPKGRLMAATTDMVNTLFAMGRMGWCFVLKYCWQHDLRATVWSALSRPYHLHVRINALARGSEPVICVLGRLGIMCCK